MRNLLFVVAIAFIISCASAALPNSSMTSLMHFNYTPGGVNFTDENGQQWTPFASAGHLPYINTTGYKFGNGSVWFYGTTDASSLSITSDDKRWWRDNHTIEFRYFPVSTAAGQMLYQQRNGSYASVQFDYDGGNQRLRIYASSTGSSMDLINGEYSTSGSVLLGNWSHIEVDYAYPLFQIYSNGSRIYSKSVSARIAKYAPSLNTTLGLNTGSNLYGGIDEYAEWNLTLNMANFTPPITEYGYMAPGVAPVANFTAVPNPSANLTEVQFTDTSANAPTSWGWLFGDGNYTSNTTQNPKHLYSGIGNYTVCLNATNAYGSNTSCAVQTVRNATSFTPRDVWMQGQYVQTFTITDSSTGAAIPVVTVTTSDGQSYTTTNGTAYFTEPFGVYVAYFSSTGYTSKSVSFIVDGDNTVAVQMTPANANNQQNTWYTPHQVRFRVFDSREAPVVGTAITARAIASTFPAGQAPSWLTNMYGINPDMANDMLNGTLIMSGTTQSDGSSVFTMHSSIGYNISIVNPANGVTQTVNVTPIDSYYTVHLLGSSVNNTALQMGYNSTLNVTEPNASFVTMNMFYQDMSGRTTLVEMYVVNRSNNNAIISYQSAVPSGSAWVWKNYTVPNTRGLQYTWYANAVRTK